jgi:hypothetical protein
LAPLFAFQYKGNMTIELLEKRKLELKAQQEQFVASANAVNGALQDCDYWIGVLKAAAAKTPADPEQ